MSSFDKNNRGERNKYLNSAETDVLIREEAEYLAKSFLEKEKFSFDFSDADKLESRLNEIYLENKKNEDEIIKSNHLWNENKKILERIEKKISGEKSLDNGFSSNVESYSGDYIKELENKINQNEKNIQSAFESFNAFMQKTTENFEKIFDFKNIDSKNEESDSVDFVKPVEWEDSNSLDSEKENKINEEKVNEILNEFSNSIDLRLSENNKKVSDLSNSISEISKNLNNYVENSENEKAGFFASISEENAKVFQDIDFVKNQYLGLEKEISKLFSNWSENNQLLINLENLLCDMTEKKNMYSQDLNDFLSETHQKVVDSQRSLNDLNNEFFELRDKIMSFDERIYNIEKNSEKLFSFDERVIELSKEVVLEELAKRNLLDPTQFLTNNDSVESLLASSVFQQSLESKITRMIVDNNNYIGEEFAAKFDRVSSDVSLVSEKLNSETIGLSKSIQNLESSFNNYKNSVDFLGFSSEIRSKIDSIDSRTNLIYSELNSKYNETNEKHKMLNTKIDDFSTNQESIIRDVIEKSEPLSDLISEKIIEVVDLKLEKVNQEFKLISENLEEKIMSFSERYNQKLLEEELDKRNSELESKIKNEALNSIYQELTKRDEKINLHSEEIVKNYEVLLENNKILESLERLVLQQADEVDVFKHDREETIELLMSKIMGQKEQIEEIRNRIADILKAAGIDIVNNSDAETDAYILESIRQVTSELVQEEIKKLNLSDITKKPELKIESGSENDFFVRRMRDILDRLDHSKSKDTEKDDGLSINVSDLKEDNPSAKDDDFGWFYEKEYENYISSKKDSAKNSLDEISSLKSAY